MQKLVKVSILCFIFMVLELLGGIIAGSLAIMTDAAHLLSDASGFFISIGAIYVARKRPTLTFNHGYH